jgi:hypothetical protein
MFDPSEIGVAIRSVREAISLVRSLGEIFRPHTTLQRRRDRQAAKSLSGLAFVELREPILRLANGTGSVEDLLKINHLIISTECDVKKCIDRLNSYEPYLREKFGLRRAISFRRILEEKASLRVRISRCLSDARQRGYDPELTLSGEKAILFLQYEAPVWLRWVDKMNDEFIELHDDILPPLQSPKKPPVKPRITKSGGKRVTPADSDRKAIQRGSKFIC